MSDSSNLATKDSMVLPLIKKFASRLGGACHILDPKRVMLRYLNRHQPLIRNKDEKQNEDDANNEAGRKHGHSRFLVI
jgi:hypothetical protein